MACIPQNCSTNLVRGGYLFASWSPNYGKFDSTRTRPLLLPARPTFIRCSLEHEGLDRKPLNKPVKVVGLGNRTNGILEFCSSSPLVSASTVEFWNICSDASEKVQSFRKITGFSSISTEGAVAVILDDLLIKHPSFLGSVVVLVAGTGFGSCDKAALELLKEVWSSGGLAVSIITKPFSFEGQKRQKEVEELIVKLAKFSNLSIVVDSDALLKREMVTLTEALRTTNNAVLLAILALSALISDSHMKVLDIIPDHSKVVSTSDVLNILQHSGKAAIGFGAGFSVKASVERAAFDCPFLSGSLIQEVKDVVISVTSAQTMDKRDIQAAIRAFRQISKSSTQIICSTILEAALEPNVIVSTIIVTGLDRHEATPKMDFWSQLSLSLPFPFSLFREGLSSKSTDGQPSLFPKKPSCSEEALSTRQSTLQNNAEKPLADDVLVRAEFQDGFKAFSNCRSNDNDRFKSQLSGKHKQFVDVTSGAYSLTGINSVAVNPSTMRKDIRDKEVMVKLDTDNVPGSSKLNGVACDLREKNILDLDSAQEICDNYKSDHTIQLANPSAYVGSRSEAMEQRSSSSSTGKANICASLKKDGLQMEYLEHHTERDEIARSLQDGSATNGDEYSVSVSTNLEISLEENDSDKNHQWIPILDDTSNIYNDNTEYPVPSAEVSLPSTQFMDKERLNCWNEGLDLCAVQAWAHERASEQKESEVDDLRLQIGGKPVNGENVNQLSRKYQTGEAMRLENSQIETPVDAHLSAGNGIADAGFGAIADIYHAASALVSGKDVEKYKNQRSLSERAASMLETERGLKKKWSPVIEMPYRGEIYKGRCQGGLPEGKGRLVLKDGSFYDGMWKYGKKSGAGTFYYSSGDVFQGSWRDDLMHGKGWFYFKNGDRWFADFWKGKANGEGRYYSKHGDVFFGHFQDNMRHGEGLYIESNGTRWHEVWEQGVLLNRTWLESEESTT